MPSEHSSIPHETGKHPAKAGSPAAFLLCGSVILALTIIVLAFAPRLGSEPPSVGELRAAGRFEPAPDIEGISHWLNGEPVTLSELRGNVVLVDFWTYTCVNCLRTIPQLRIWHDRYTDDGLRIIGIHTPEFEFEKDPANVMAAAQAQGVTWPIALDNDYLTWDNFENLFWPTKYLIDHRGLLRYRLIGEGNYQSFEEEMRSLLLEAGNSLSDDPPTHAVEHQPDARYEAAPDRYITPELYAGYERGDFQREYYGVGFVGQPEYYDAPNRTLDLVAPEYLEPDQIYFQGTWRNEGQRALYLGEAPDFEDYVALVYSAKTVNVVMASEGVEPAKVRVKLDGEFLTEENRGADITIDGDGESYLMVDESRMYRVVEKPEYSQRRKLELSVKSEGLAVFAFTFGIYAEGP